MNKKLLGLLTCSLVTTQSFGVELVKDINSLPGASPAYLWYGTTEISSGTLMVIEDYIHGAELFISDGTANGTRLVRDIRPGADGSAITSLVTMAGVAYFFADDGVNGRELWRSDGTTAGTHIVSNIGAGSASGTPDSPDERLVNANGVLFFPASDAATGLELWRSDGTNAGTYRLTDSMAGAPDGLPSDLVAVGSRVFFVAQDSAGRELWVSDGSIAGTHRVADILPGAGSPDISGLVAAGGALYFRATDGTHGSELWRASGDGTGATMLADLNTAGGSNPTNVAAFGDGVMFVADVTTSGVTSSKLVRATASSTVILASAGGPNSLNRFVAVGSGAIFGLINGSGSGNEVWFSDGTAANTRAIGAGNIAFTGAAPQTSPNGSEAFFFAGTTGGSTSDLWRSDGTLDGTRVYAALATSNQAPASILPVGGGRVFFPAGNYGQNLGVELWVSDGTVGGTHVVRDIAPGPDSSSPNNLQRVGARVIFTPSGGDFPWLSDGTEAGTVPLSDIDGRARTLSSSARAFGTLGSTTFISADDGVHGTELWATDGTEAGTRLVKDLVPGAEGGNPRTMQALNANVALFMGSSGPAPFTVGTLWRTDGTSSGTYQLRTFDDTRPTLGGENAAVLNGVAYFTVFNTIGRNELWRSDGTVAGTYEIVPATGPQSFSVFKATAGNRVLMSVHMTTHVDLWWTDGTPAGTVKANDTLDVYPAFWSVQFQGRACFTGRQSPSEFQEVWCTNGTDNDFVRITNFEAMNTLANGAPFVVNGRLLIGGIFKGSFEGGVFATDGTPASTQKISDKRIGSGVTVAVAANGSRAYYFGMNSYGTGTPAVTDGTVAGTHDYLETGAPFPLDDIVATAAFGERFVFAVRNFPNAGRLWYTDGTTAGTKLLADINPGVQSFADPGDLYPVGSRLYFRAQGADVGEELWSLSLAGPNANHDSATTAYGTAVSVNVLANDSDMDSTLNQASVQIVAAPASGTTTVDLATGAITYTPNGNFTGTDRFSYRVSDPQNHLSNLAFVDVIVKPQAVAAAPGTEPTAPPVTPPATPPATPPVTPPATTPVTPPTTSPGKPSASGGGGAMGVELWAFLLATILAGYSRGRAATTCGCWNSRFAAGTPGEG